MCIKIQHWIKYPIFGQYFPINIEFITEENDYGRIEVIEVKFSQDNCFVLNKKPSLASLRFAAPGWAEWLWPAKTPRARFPYKFSIFGTA